MISVTIDLRDFEGEIKDLERKIGEAHRDMQAEIVGRTMDDLVERSPVRTGAYRAAHFVAIGREAPERAVYDGPDHPIPDKNYTPGAQPIFTPPDGRLAQRAYEGEEPYQRALISNDRFYASLLEYGTATMAPRAIYETAAANAELVADGLARAGLDLGR